ncbi:MAG: response regulator transcription factor [Lachnospiraceae bacterium]|nr:response regulator transcription factor [Lachnospiraceae bacterium]
MLRIAIVDDEQSERERLKRFVERYFRERGEDVCLSLYDDGAALLQAASEALDLLFLDIRMEQVDGLSAARQIRMADEEVQIVFITNMAQYAIDGYSVSALDFLVKPIDEERTARVLEKAEKRLGSRNPEMISVRNSEGFFVVDAKDILYIETDGRHLLLHTAAAGMRCHETLQSMEEKLPGHFFRCHNAFLVNLWKVEHVKGGDIVAGGRKVPLSKHRRREFMQAMTRIVKERL